MIPTVAAPQARSRSATFATRWLPVVGLLLFGALILIPNWILLPRDDEGLIASINPTLFEARHVFTSYPFWNPFTEFGMPLPGGESLIFHPFVIVAHFASLAFSLALLYQVQLWIGLISAWAACRRLRMNEWVAAVCALTYGLCTVSIQLQTDFWPDFWVTWTLAPLLLFLLLKLIESESRKRRAFFSVAAGLCGGLILLDGHLGVVPVFGIGFAAFLVGNGKVVRPVLPWIGLGVVVLFAASSTRIYDLSLENARSVSPHKQQRYAFDLGQFLFYPHGSPEHGARNVAFGLPFVLLVLLGLVWIRKSGPYSWGLRLAVVVCFVAWFLPVDWNPAVSGNWLYGQSLTFFSIFLAGLALQWIWDRVPRLRVAAVALAGLQIAILAYGFYHEFYGPSLRDARSYLNGAQVSTLKNTFKNQEIYRFFEQRPDHPSTRVLMTPGARDRLWRTLTDYNWSAWQWHGLRLVNGQMRGVDIGEFQFMKKALHGDIRGESDLSQGDDDLHKTASTLDIFNVGYLLARPGEQVATSLVPLHRFQVPDPDHEFGTTDSMVIVAYRNPSHWGDAVVVSPRIRQLSSFRQRPTCTIPGLLCDDLSAVVPLRRPAGVSAQRWSGATLDVGLAASSRPRVLMVSQMYRPGWRAKLSDGRTTSGYQVLGGLTGFDIPPGVRSAEISFHPTERIVFASLSWATVFVSIVFLVAAASLGWLRRVG